MIDERTQIRNDFQALLNDEFTEFEVTANRVYEHTKYPSGNLKSGPDTANLEAHAGDTTGREYEIEFELRVASANHDDEIDGYIKRVREVLKANRKNPGVWSYALLGDIEEPETEAGATNYTLAVPTIIFYYEA